MSSEYYYQQQVEEIEEALKWAEMEYQMEESNNENRND